jgi:hypothetical protein
MPKLVSIAEMEAMRNPPKPPKKQLQPIPCANCARIVISTTRQRTYCSDLCSQVAVFVRYFQRVRADGRWKYPDIIEALGVRLAHIAAGGYDNRGRSLSPQIRDEIIERDQGMCRNCGKPGNEIDHIAGSSADPSNLQLLCRDCHMAKTQRAMKPAAPDVIATVHGPIQDRALESPNRQPCDDMGWKHTLWVSGVKEVSEKLLASWTLWLEGPGLAPVDPQTAVKGFPTELEPWSWYLGEATEIEVGLPEDDELAEARRASHSEYLREWKKEYLAKQAKQAARRKELRDRPIIRLLPFRPPVSGKGKWHVSHADAYGATPTEYAGDPTISTACGQGTVELNPKGKALSPSVGDQISKYTDRLCGTCLALTQKVAS